MPAKSAVGPQQAAAAHAVSWTLGAVQRVTGEEGKRPWTGRRQDDTPTVHLQAWGGNFMPT